MRNSLKIVLATLLIVVPTLGFAQQKNIKFGYVSSEEILTTIPDRDSAMVTLQKYGKELEATLEGMQVELNNKIEKVRQDEAAGKLSDLVKKTRYEEVTSMQQRIQQFQENAQTEYQQKQMQLMQPIIEKIKKAISDVGKENSFTMIFDTSTNAIPYIAADNQDVTNLVKQKLGIKAKQ